MSSTAIFEPLIELDEESLQKAKTELNQKDNKQVKADIEYIRKWLSKHDYLNGKIDDDLFILTFLRSARFSYSKTQELLENFWVNRTEMKEFFYDRSLKDESTLMEIADSGQVIYLPKHDSKGRKIWLARPTEWEPKKHDFNDFAKYLTCSADLIWLDQRTHIYGVIILMDLSKLNSEHVSYCTPQRIQKVFKLVEKTYPVRINAIHVFNYPKLFDTVYALVKPFLNERLKQKVYLHGSDLESLKKHISESILPLEYGGKGESINFLSDKWIEYMKSKESYIKSFESHTVNLEKYKKKNKRDDSKGQKQTSAEPAVVGTFRKLNID